MNYNLYIKKFKAMTFEEKKKEILKLLYDIVKYSFRAKELVQIIPNMQETEENNKKLILDYSDLIKSINEVDEEEKQKKEKELEKKVKKLEKIQKEITEKRKILKEKEKKEEYDFDDLINNL